MTKEWRTAGLGSHSFLYTITDTHANYLLAPCINQSVLDVCVCVCVCVDYQLHTVSDQLGIPSYQVCLRVNKPKEIFPISFFLISIHPNDTCFLPNLSSLTLLNLFLSYFCPPYFFNQPNKF
jgi:hypothetical protein